MRAGGDGRCCATARGWRTADVGTLARRRRAVTMA